MPATLSNPVDLQKRLQTVEAYLAHLSAHIAKVEGERDSLIRQLSDHEGCDDRRFAVR